MIYKEKLAGGGDSKTYTHIIRTVYFQIQRDDYYSYNKNNNAASLIPSTLNNDIVIDITYTNAIYPFSIEMQSLYTDKIYLAEYKSKSCIEIPVDSVNQDKSVYYTTSEYNRQLAEIFKSALSTPQQIWISTTPPPWA